jgi:uncharacterized metal-binding protein YceD (DUF177 family)
MKNKEINLHLIPAEGEDFVFSAQELDSLRPLKETLISNPKNTVSLSIKPIDGPHYQIKTKYKIECSRQCSRCGVDFNKEVSKEHEDYLSTQIKEGEDEGFILVEKPEQWNWAEYLRQTVELDTPYQELCKEDCKPEDDRVLIGEPDRNLNSPFEKLKELKTLKKH